MPGRSIAAILEDLLLNGISGSISNDFASATNATATITLSAPGIGKRLWIKQVWWSFSAAPAATATLTITREAGTCSFDITEKGPGFLPVDLTCGVNEGGVTISLSAGGTGVVGKVGASVIAVV